ncbi:MAG: hypothetical protein HZC42_10000 [Candidatus Eisenbacteria bacterium]|nr:hypothetical protein [Candidatus Eisenbacteria bacterium]
MGAAGLGLLSRLSPRVAFRAVGLAPRPVSVAPVNALGNSVDDFAIGDSSQVVLARLLEGECRAVWQQNLTGPAMVEAALDVNGDGFDEVCVTTRDGDGTTRAILMSRDGMKSDTLGPVAGAPARGRPWVGWLRPVAMLPRPGRGPAVVCLVCGVWKGPRGIACYDPASGGREWFYAMGGWPHGVVVADLRGDGRPGLLVTTSSPANGVSENGTDDAHAYVLALSGEGRRLWLRELAGGFTEAKGAALPGEPGHPARVVVAASSHRGANPERCGLAVLDGASGAEIRSLSFPRGLGQPRVLDGAAGRFVVGGADGVLRLFNRDLKPLATHGEPSAVEAWACVDVDGDGANEVLASTARDVLVLDSNLRVMGRRRHENAAGPPTRLLPARAGLQRWRVCAVGQRALAMDLIPVSPLRDPRRLAWVLGAALAAGTAAGVVRRERRRRRLPTPAESRDFLVDYLQVRHEVLEEVRPFGALRLWAQRTVDGQTVPLDVFERARDEFVRIGAGALCRFTARAAELAVEPARVREIEDLTRALQEGLSHPEPPDGHRARELSAAMQGLSDACAAVWRDVASHLRCRADIAAHDAMLAKQRLLVERGVTAHFSGDPGGGAHVLFDPAELRELAGQLVENAAEALHGVPGATLQVSVLRDPLDHRWVVLLVADNGPGIPHDRREAVFRPDCSTRPGGGFGLPHARETARRWRGELSIEDSPEGTGTMMKLMLRVLFPFDEENAETRPVPKEATR